MVRSSRLRVSVGRDGSLNLECDAWLDPSRCDLSLQVITCVDTLFFSPDRNTWGELYGDPARPGLPQLRWQNIIAVNSAHLTIVSRPRIYVCAITALARTTRLPSSLRLERSSPDSGSLDSGSGRTNLTQWLKNHVFHVPPTR